MKARKLLLLSLYRFVQLTIQEGVDHAEQLCLQDLPKELLYAKVDAILSVLQISYLGSM